MLPYAGLGVYWVTSPGPVESALRDYVRAAGRDVGPMSVREVAPHFALTPGGGAVLGVSGRLW